MRIGELSRLSGVPAKTIRTYETVGVLDRPKRRDNGYRDYQPHDMDTLSFVAGARRLGISLAGIKQLGATRRRGIAPCGDVLETIDRRVAEVDDKIGGLVALRERLVELRDRGWLLPLDDVAGEGCVCYLVKSYRTGDRVEIARTETRDE